ncbi:MAG: GntR family transcriptional regulator [Ruminococcus sp.]|jgi:GntR family transcriptional regulator of arabinose operon
MADFKYKQVADRLRVCIEDGTFKSNERIPTEPELCEQFHVGRQTLRKAVTLMEEAGYLKRIQGSGTYVCEREEHLSGDGLQNTQEYTLEMTAAAGENRAVTLIMMNGKSYVFLDIMRGISDVLTSNGYILNILITDGDYDKERIFLENMMQNPPAGLLFEPVCSGLLSINYPLYRSVFSKIPAFMIHMDSVPSFPYIALNDRHGSKLLADYLISLGHKRIGTVYSFDEYTGQNRYRGFLDALREHNIPHISKDNVWMFHDQTNDLFEAGGCIALERMYKEVTAIMCHDDRVASKLIGFLNKRKIRVPEDISVVGYDNSLYSELGVSITTVTHPGKEYGKMAAEALLQMIHSPGSVDLSRYSVEPKLVIRDSTGPPPAE